ncbi:Hint domain-containing protein [Acetobacter sp.]|jgi:hypothetical protein|uniref:Hint domain-containing protein n=1 Tax=Acetobacter sp. TaxID=440 RepID=UPI0025C4172C|nr:Hint domain-containing protein [Acetobacter sp.]
MASYTDQASGLTYTVNQSDLLGLFYNVVISDSSGNTIKSLSSVPVGNIITGSGSSLSLVSILTGTYVSVPGSTGNINIAINALSGLNFYIGGDTTVSLGVSAITGLTLNVYGGDLTFSSGIVASALSGSTINIGYGGTYSSGSNLASILNGSTVNFTTGGGTLILNAGGSLLDLSSTSITGYDPSKDTIELENTTATISGYIVSGSGSSRTVTLVGTDGKTIATYTATLASGVTLADGVYSTSTTDTTSNPLKITYHDGNTYIGACFLPGTLIRTPSGEVLIEDVRIGDTVSVFNWRNGVETQREVTWVGSQKMVVRSGLPDDEAGYPVRVLKDAISDGVPYKDMLITPEHCLFFEDKFVPVRMLVNGRSIFYDRTITSYSFYHVETQEHSVIWADGMLTESYLDTGNRASFRQHGNLVILAGAQGKSWGEDGGAPLGVTCDFVEPLFRSIESRAEAGQIERKDAAPVLTDETDIHLVTETGAVIRKAREHDGSVMFMIPASVRNVRIVSNASRPSDVFGPFVDDRRRLGVAIGDITLFESRRTVPVTSHLTVSDLTGWHGLEGESCRWTTGDALLPLGERPPAGVAMLTLQLVAAGPYLVSDTDGQTLQQSV